MTDQAKQLQKDEHQSSGSDTGGGRGELHHAIMNLPCPKIFGGGEVEAAYKLGHKDARHAAAELVAASSVGERAPEGDGDLAAWAEWNRKWAPEGALRALVEKWRESAEFEFDSANQQYGQALDQCADELAALMADDTSKS